MTNQDNLAQALSAINNAEKVAKKEIVVRPASKIIISVLDFIKKNDYISSYESIKTSRGGEVKVNLKGNINKIGVIKPRFSVKYKDIEKFEKRYLPAKDFGAIIISTPKGLVDQIQARESRIGGRLIAYVY